MPLSEGMKAVTELEITTTTKWNNRTTFLIGYVLANYKLTLTNFDKFNVDAIFMTWENDSYLFWRKRHNNDSTSINIDADWKSFKSK